MINFAGVPDPPLCAGSLYNNYLFSLSINMMRFGVVEPCDMDLGHLFSFILEPL